MSVASCLPSAPAFRFRLLPRPRPPRRPRPTATCDPQCSLPDLNHDHPRAQCSLPDLNHDHPRPVFPSGPQPRPSPPSVPCRTSTTTIPGPQPRPSTPSVPCRTSTASINAKCSLPDLNLGPAQLSVHRWTSTAR